MIRPVLSLLLSLGSVFGQESSPDLHSNLSAIGSGSSLERQAAERWLAAHIEPQHLEALAQVARAGDLEVRRRLSRAIGQADRDLSLASAMLATGEPVLEELGRRAMEFNLTDWNVELWRNAIHGQSLALHLRLLSSDSWPEVLRVPILPTLGETCAFLQQHVGLPVGLAVAPSVAGRKPGEGFSSATGTWEELVARLAEIYHVSFDGHGFHPDPPSGTEQVFLRFCPPAQLAQTSTEVLSSWCREVLFADKLSLRVDAARALAASGWEAGLEWLSTRVAQERDPAALEGVMAAAAMGRHAAVLGDPELLRSMLSTAQADFEAGDPEGRGRRILAAFQHMRSLGPGGQARAALILEGWDAASLAGRWLRLAILRELRSPDGRQLAASLLADASLAPLLYRQALATWIAASVGLPGVEPPHVAAPELLFGALDDVRDALDHARHLPHNPIEPPAQWKRPEQLPSGFGFLERASVLSWYILLGESEAGAQHWCALLQGNSIDWRLDSQALAEVLGGIAGAHADKLRASWRSARAAPQTELQRLALDRCALLAGILEVADEDRVWGELKSLSMEQGLDLMVMACIAGRGWTSEPGQAARSQLLKELNLALRSNRSVEACAQLLGALERSVAEMEKIGWELSRVGVDRGRRSMSEQWSEEILRATGPYRRNPLGTHFMLHWPPEPGAGLRDLEAEARLPLTELRLSKETATEGATFRR